MTRLHFSHASSYVAALIIVTIVGGCGGPLPTGNAATGTPAAIAQVRLFDEARGTELTLHTGLPDDQSVRLEVRLYAPDGHRLTDIVGGVAMTLRFAPESLATAVPVPGRPLQTVVTPTAAAGTSGTQTVTLSFPSTGTSKTFGPFHVQVQRGAGGQSEFRLFDAFNSDFTEHVPLLSGEMTRLEVRLYDSTGVRRTAIPGGAEITTSFVWGANVPTDTRRVLNTALVEANVDLDPRNAVFGRAEYVTRTADELSLVGSVSEEVPVGALALGYARRLRDIRGVGAWLGARGDMDFVPEQLRLFYGSRTPVGFIVYLQLRPAPMMEPMSH